MWSTPRRVATLADHLENLALLDAGSGAIARGNALANEISGNRWNDTLEGGAGDALQGQNGNDIYQIDLGSGQDMIRESSGDDTIVTAANENSHTGASTVSARGQRHAHDLLTAELRHPYPTGSRAVRRSWSRA